MARLYTWCSEQNFLTVPGEIHQVGAGTLVIDTTYARSGTYGLHTTSLVSATAQRASYRFVATEAAGPYFTRAYWRGNTRPTAANTIMRLVGSFTVITVKLNNDGTLTLADEVGTIGTSSFVCGNGVDYRFEMKFDATGAGGTHEIRLLVDGVEVVGSNTRTFTHTTIQQIDVGGNLGGESQTVGEWWWDDGAINDNTGSVQNSYPGSGKVILLKAAGNGDANVGLTRGGTDTGSDWGQVAELTPDDIGTYVDLTTTSGVIWCTVDAPTVIGSADTITFIAVGARVTAASAATTNWFPSIKSQAGGTAVDGTVTSLATTTWGHHDDTTGVQQYKLHQYVDPQSGGAWTKALVQGMQIGAKTSDGTPAARISTLWAIVEYIPAPGPVLDADYLIYQVVQP